MQPPIRPSQDETSPSPATDPDAMFATRGCCCFWVPWSADHPPSSIEGWERVRNDDRRAVPWWRRSIKALMKIREWSELVAGPRWKTFIRRFNRKGGGGRRWKKYQYDPLSYALNFDEGRGDESPDRDAAFRDFSSRYASIPVSAKSSMDLGGRDGPPLFDPIPEGIH